MNGLLRILNRCQKFLLLWRRIPHNCVYFSISLASLIFRSGLFFVQSSVFLIGDEEHFIAILDVLLSFSLIIRFIRTIRTLFSFTSTTCDIFVFCLIATHALSFLSNSYILFESSVIRFVTQSVVNFAFWQSFSSRCGIFESL